MVDAANEDRKLFALNRNRNLPKQTAIAITGSGAPQGDQGVVDGNFLRTDGDTMIGPIAFFPKLYFMLSGDTSINVGQSQGDEVQANSSYVLVTPGAPTNANDIETIYGASFSGQIIYLQGTQGGTLTLKDASSNTGGNIITPDNNDLIINGANIVTLIFDVTISPNPGVAGGWRVISAGSAGSVGTYISADLTADQTGASLVVNNHVEFDRNATPTGADGGIVLQTGTGQANGIFELKANKNYFLSAAINPKFTGSGTLIVAWYDITNSTEIGRRVILDDTTTVYNQPKAEIIFAPTADANVEVRFISITGTFTTVISAYTYAHIFELGGAGSGSGGGGITFPILYPILNYGNVSGAVNIDLSASTAHVSLMRLTGNITLSFSNPPPATNNITFEIQFTQDGTGGHTVTWPVNVLNPPTIDTTANSTSLVTLQTNDGGTTYIAFLAGSATGSGGQFLLADMSNLANPTVPNKDIEMNGQSITDQAGAVFSNGAGISGAAAGFIEYTAGTGQSHLFKETTVSVTNLIDIQASQLVAGIPFNMSSNNLINIAGAEFANTAVISSPASQIRSDNLGNLQFGVGNATNDEYAWYFGTTRYMNFATFGSDILVYAVSRNLSLGRDGSSNMDLQNTQTTLQKTLNVNNNNLTTVGSLLFGTAPLTISNIVPEIAVFSGTDLTYNVPTASSHDIRINDVGKVTIQNTSVTFQNGVNLTINNNQVNDASRYTINDAGTSIPNSTIGMSASSGNMFTNIADTKTWELRTNNVSVFKVSTSGTSPNYDVEVETPKDLDINIANATDSFRVRFNGTQKHFWSEGFYIMSNGPGPTPATIRPGGEGLRIGLTGGSADKISLHGVTPVIRESVTGSRGGNAALADLLTKLANKGIIFDNTNP